MRMRSMKKYVVSMVVVGLVSMMSFILYVFYLGDSFEFVVGSIDGMGDFDLLGNGNLYGIQSNGLIVEVMLEGVQVRILVVSSGFAYGDQYFRIIQGDNYKSWFFGGIFKLQVFSVKFHFCFPNSNGLDFQIGCVNVGIGLNIGFFNISVENGQFWRF